MSFKLLRLDQARQTADFGQVVDVLREGRARLTHFRGAMRWKTVKGHEYLYRRVGVRDTSLGPRSAETERIKAAFEQGKLQAQALHEGARRRIDEMAPVNRAMGLGRVPLTAARILRRLEGEGLLGRSVAVVGTNSLYAYEAMAGGHFSADLASTEDIDLLFDSRRRIQIISEEMSASGLAGLVRTVDGSFQKLSNGFRMVNGDNYLVDLIAPMSKDVLRSKPQGITQAAGDLVAAEIEGLQWLVNAPKVAATVMDVRGLPVPMSCVDPRCYAIHKLWLSGLDGRNPAKRNRDKAQAAAVAALVTQHLPALRFDDRALEALPKALRASASALATVEPPTSNPDW